MFKCIVCDKKFKGLECTECGWKRTKTSYEILQEYLKEKPTSNLRLYTIAVEKLMEKVEQESYKKVFDYLSVNVFMASTKALKKRPVIWECPDDRLESAKEHFGVEK